MPFFNSSLREWVIWIWAKWLSSDFCVFDNKFNEARELFCDQIFILWARSLLFRITESGSKSGVLWITSLVIWKLMLFEGMLKLIKQKKFKCLMISSAYGKLTKLGRKSKIFSFFGKVTGVADYDIWKNFCGKEVGLSASQSFLVFLVKERLI